MNEQKIRARVSPHLPPGETYRAAFQAGVGPHPRFAYRYRVVAVTDRSVHLFSASLWRACEPKRLVATLPPGTVIQSRREQLIYEVVHLAGERLWVTLAFQGLLRDAIEASHALAAPSWE